MSLWSGMSCGGRVLCNGSIPYSEESYRACVLSTIGCKSNFLQCVGRRGQIKKERKEERLEEFLYFKFIYY